MKKRWIRVIAAVMMCVLLCTSLSGCSVIDKLRAANATKPDADTIAWNGVNYKRIDDTLSEQIALYDFDYDRMVYINTDNVPALLLPFLCVEYTPTKNDVFLFSNNYKSLLFSSTETMTWSYYCREDRYEDIVHQLVNGLNFTGLIYEYYDYEKEDTFTYRFSKEECDAFKDSMSPMNRSKTPIEDYEWSTMVHPCTDDGLIGEMYEIIEYKGAYYIAAYLDLETDYDADYEEDFDEFEYSMEYYRVPEKYNELFRKLLTDSMQEKEFYSEEYEWDAF